MDSEDEYDLDPDEMASRKPAITVRTFCGTSGEDIEEWLSRRRRTVVANRWNDKEELQMLSAFLDGAVEEKLNQGGNSVTLNGKRARCPLKC